MRQPCLVAAIVVTSNAASAGPPELDRALARLRQAIETLREVSDGLAGQGPGAPDARARSSPVGSASVTVAPAPVAPTAGLARPIVEANYLYETCRASLPPVACGCRKAALLQARQAGDARPVADVVEEARC